MLEVLPEVQIHIARYVTLIASLSDALKAVGVECDVVATYGLHAYMNFMFLRAPVTR